MLLAGLRVYRRNQPAIDHTLIGYFMFCFGGDATHGDFVSHSDGEPWPPCGSRLDINPRRTINLHNEKGVA